MEPKTVAVEAMPKASLEQMLATIQQQNLSTLDQMVNDTNLEKIARALINWRTVCTNLGISEAEEEAIKEENPGVDARRMAVLRKWRSKYGPTATYRNLASCFYHANELALVETVCQVLRVSPMEQQQEDNPVHMSVNNSSSQELPSALRHELSTVNGPGADLTNTLSSQTSFQQLSRHEQEELKEILENDVRKMKRDFGYLVTKTRDSIEERIPVEKFVTSILALTAYEPAPEGRDPSLLDEHQDEIKGAKTITEIFNILCAYWNYLNYEILEYIIELYGTIDDTKRLTNYCEKFHKFCDRRIFELPMSESGSGTGNASNPRQEKFIVKLDVRGGTTCKEVCRIKGRIAEILHVNRAILMIGDVDAGCVQLTFLIPRFVAHEIFPLSDEQTSALAKDVSVIRLECGNHVFQITTKTEGQSRLSLDLERVENNDQCVSTTQPRPTVTAVEMGQPSSSSVSSTTLQPARATLLPKAMTDCGFDNTHSEFSSVSKAELVEDQYGFTAQPRPTASVIEMGQPSSSSVFSTALQPVKAIHPPKAMTGHRLGRGEDEKPNELTQQPIASLKTHTGQTSVPTTDHSSTTSATASLGISPYMPMSNMISLDTPVSSFVPPAAPLSSLAESTGDELNDLSVLDDEEPIPTETPCTGTTLPLPSIQQQSLPIIPPPVTQATREGINLPPTTKPQLSDSSIVQSTAAPLSSKVGPSGPHASTNTISSSGKTDLHKETFQSKPSIPSPQQNLTSLPTLSVAPMKPPPTQPLSLSLDDSTKPAASLAGGHATVNQSLPGAGSHPPTPKTTARETPVKAPKTTQTTATLPYTHVTSVPAKAPSTRTVDSKAASPPTHRKSPLAVAKTPDVGTPNLLSDSYPEDVDAVRCEIIGDQVKAKQLEMECGDFPSIMETAETRHVSFDNNASPYQGDVHLRYPQPVYHTDVQKDNLLAAKETDEHWVETLNSHVARMELTSEIQEASKNRSQDHHLTTRETEEHQVEPPSVYVVGVEGASPEIQKASNERDKVDDQELLQACTSEQWDVAVLIKSLEAQDKPAARRGASFQMRDQAAKVEEVLQMFSQICMSAITCNKDCEQFLQLLKALGAPSHISSFIQEYYGGLQGHDILMAKFIVSDIGVSPANFFITHQFMDFAQFHVHAMEFFPKGPEKFYEELVWTFHQISGGEDLPYDVNRVLDGMFGGQFTLNVQTTAKQLQGHLPIQHHTWQQLPSHPTIQFYEEPEFRRKSSVEELSPPLEVHKTTTRLDKREESSGMHQPPMAKSLTLGENDGTSCIGKTHGKVLSETEDVNDLQSLEEENDQFTIQNNLMQEPSGTEKYTKDVTINLDKESGYGEIARKVYTNRTRENIQDIIKSEDSPYEILNFLRNQQQEPELQQKQEQMQQDQQQMQDQQHLIHQEKQQMQDQQQLMHQEQQLIQHQQQLIHQEQQLMHQKLQNVLHEIQMQQGLQPVQLELQQMRQEQQQVQQKLQDLLQELQVQRSLVQPIQQMWQKLQDLQMQQELQAKQPELAAERTTLKLSTHKPTSAIPGRRKSGVTFAAKPRCRIPVCNRRMLSRSSDTLQEATANNEIPNSDKFYSISNPTETRYRLHVLSPFNVLLPAQANFIFVIVISTPENQQRFEESLKEKYSYMNLHPSKRCLVRFNRDARAKFHVDVLNPATFEVEAKGGLEEITEEDVLSSDDHPPCIYYQVSPVQGNAPTHEGKFTLTATGIEDVAQPSAQLEVPVTLYFGVQKQAAAGMVPSDDEESHHVSKLGSIRGVDVIGDAKFTVLIEGGSFDWKGYGLRLYVSKGSLPPSMGECIINIRASLSGQFQLPENSDLLSPVFWIAAPCKFTKPVTLEIQHCALREYEAELSNLSFVSAKCSQRDLPYRFRQVDGGVFTSHSSYGSIQLSHFSGNAVTGRKSTPQSYCAHLYHTMKQMYDWRFYFVITQDLELKNTVVKEHYGHFAKREATLRVGFERSKITLDIPEDGLVTDEGWKITPFSHPTISRKDADAFKPGQWIPECQLIVQWKGKDPRPVQLMYKVKLIGAKAPYNFIHLTLNPETEEHLSRATSRAMKYSEGLHRKYPSGLGSQPELSDLMNEIAAKIPSRWMDVGLQLGLDQDALEGIALISPGDTNHCYSNVFTRWKNQNSTTHPYTWFRILQALKTPAVGQGKLASAIKKKLIRH